MAVDLDNYTLTYNGRSNGWPSFYSYFPEMIQGMNQYLYTFYKGNLYRHNVNETRNQYYNQSYDLGEITPTHITTIINERPLESKLFKTIELESDGSWETALETDVQSARTIQAAWFEEKEGNWFAFIRGLTTSGATNFLMRSANGIGEVVTVDNSTPTAATLTFAATLDLGSIISVGDSVYTTSDPATVAPALAGEVVTAPSTSNILTIDTTGATVPLNDDFILYQKNQIAESHGILGKYCQVTLTNDSIAPVELYAIRTDIMRSHP